jgi:hypothetical protein
MEKVLLADFVKKYFPKWKEIVETVNGSRKELTYLFKEMLTKEYSVDMKWESNSISRTYVAADVVAMDSSLPLKKRDAITHANGDLPKLGMKMLMREKAISDLNILVSRGANEAVIVKKLFEDALKCTNGIDERIEYMFLKALSDGITVVSEDYNVGTGIRVDFGFKNANKFGVAVEWGETGYTPITDIKKVLSKASENGDTIETIVLSKSAYNLLRNSQEGKELAAIFGGLVITSNVSLPVPTPARFNEAFKDETGCELLIVDRNIKIEKNGTQTNVRPFNDVKLTFLVSKEVGKLYYGTLAEETNPVENVEYAKANEYCQTKKYHTAEPYAEISAAQALVLPVIENVDQIYSLDIETEEA